VKRFGLTTKLNFKLLNGSPTMLEPGADRRFPPTSPATRQMIHLPTRRADPAHDRNSDNISKEKSTHKLIFDRPFVTSLAFIGTAKWRKHWCFS